MVLSGCVRSTMGSAVMGNSSFDYFDKLSINSLRTCASLQPAQMIDFAPLAAGAFYQIKIA